MPLKFSKGFQRRKSSGNALEELANPPQPSFRVFERPASKSFDAGNTLKRMSQGRPLSAGPQLEENRFSDSSIDPGTINRGSGGTNNSASSGGHNDNSSTSARYSSSSTLPSSTDVSLDEKPLPVPKDAHHVPIPPIPQPNPPSLRAAGRAFSFGRKKAHSPLQSALPELNSKGYPSATRERAMTESSYTSGSTATPPKLLDSDLDLGDSDAFGNMFESFGKRRSQVMGEFLGSETTESPKNMSPGSPQAPMKSYFATQPHYAPSPNQIDRSREVQSPPFSWSSQSSQDGLMHPSSPTAANPSTNSHETSSTPKNNRISLSSRMIPASSHRPRMQRPTSSTGGAGLRRSSAYSSPRDSDIYQDEDAQLVMDSLHASGRLNHQSGVSKPYRDDEGGTNTHPSSPIANSSAHPFPSSAAPGPPQAAVVQNNRHSPAALFDSDDQEFQNSRLKLEPSQTTPRAKQLNPPYQSGTSSLELSHASSRYPLPSDPQSGSSAKPAVVGQNKVMTPAQFNLYKKEQEMNRSRSNASASGESDGDNDDYDDDEVERNKQAAKQRRKQEAHMAVYRQQMMKMTGEQPSDLPFTRQARFGSEKATGSTSDLPGRYVTPSFTFDKPANRSKGSDDEDEDVPLGILAAHGFPNKNRPPSVFSTGGLNSNIKYTSESYPSPPMSSAAPTAAGGKSLPPFARNLPPDPYYGAGLVNPPNRESLTFGANSGGSVYGGYSPNPGGLVGVIADEERARAMRRGSPNSQGNYGYPLPQGMSQGNIGMPPGAMPTPMMMTPGDEAQIQMSQQMSQMMQMQMQWMQQIQQMISGGTQGQLSGAQPGLPPQLIQPHQQQMMSQSFLSPPTQASRPISVGSPSAPGTAAAGIQTQQRTRSMVSPSIGPQWSPSGNVRLTAPSIMSGGLGGPSYTPSIAPSERSNVGIPSRYRPVSIAPIDELPRPGSRASTLMSGALQAGANKGSTLAADVKSAHSSRQKVHPASDDDDEEGWEEMKKNREKKKVSRGKRNDHDDIHDMYYPEA